jgi:hypothetical protein
MRFSIPGARHRDESATPAPPAPPLSTVRVAVPHRARSLGRRELDLIYGRVFMPSLVVDHTELMLRQHGASGAEGFGVWAGTLSGGDAFVSTLVIPRVSASGDFHGEVSEDTVANVLDELDELDLVPIAQIHSHPQEAFLSPTDAQRPIVAARGFISIVIPGFGFVDLANTGLWRAYEFHARESWRELDAAERDRRFVIDPSLLRID